MKSCSLVETSTEVQFLRFCKEFSSDLLRQQIELVFAENSKNSCLVFYAVSYPQFEASFVLHELNTHADSSFSDCSTTLKL